MSVIVTAQVQQFREAARHLWNSALRPQVKSDTADEAAWDTADAFREICRVLFQQIVLQGTEATAIPVNFGDDCIPLFRLFADHRGKLPLMVSRDVPPSGYWDYPVEWIPPEGPNDIQPICFLDFDQLGYRNLEYYRARILKCPSHPDIEGRDALIKCEYVEIEIAEQTA